MHTHIYSVYSYIMLYVQLAHMQNMLQLHTYTISIPRVSWRTEGVQTPGSEGRQERDITCVYIYIYSYI